MLSTLVLTQVAAFGYSRWKAIMKVDETETVVPSRLLSKIHVQLLPILLLVVTLNYIDRTNLAFASLQFNQDLKLSPEEYGLGSGLFFLGYCIFMVPSNLVMVRVGPPRWLALIMTIWGGLASAFCLVQTKSQFYAFRFLIGVAESGAFPCVWYYLTYFYPADTLTLPYAIIEGAVGVANVVAAPLAALLLTLNGWLGLRGWQWLFLLEGLPSVTLGLLSYVLLPADHTALRALSTAERRWLAAKLAASRRQHLEAETLSTPAMVSAAFRNGSIWFLGTVGLFKSSAGHGLLFWLPIILDHVMKSVLPEAAAGVDRTGAFVALLTAVPFVCTAGVAVLLGVHSHRTGERFMHVAVPYLASGLIMCAFPRALQISPWLALAALTVAMAGAIAPNGVLNSLASHLGSGPALSVSLALYNAYSNLGGVVGPWLIGKLVAVHHNYTAPLVVLGTLMCGTSVAVLAFSYGGMQAAKGLEKRQGDQLGADVGDDA